MLDKQEKAKYTARWLLDTGALIQFRVAVEVEEENIEEWEALAGLYVVLT